MNDAIPLAFIAMGGPQSQRNLAIAKMRAEGASLAAIGEAFGVTRERARQILQKTNGPTAADAKRARADAARARDLAMQQRIRNLLAAVGVTTYGKAATELNLPEEEVRRVWPDELKTHLIDARNYETKWSDEEIRSALQRAGTFDYPLRGNAYERLRQLGEVHGPSRARLLQRFGTWRKACEFAGVEADKSPRDSYQSKWTDADLLDAVRAYLDAREWGGTFANFDKWRREHMPDGPSSSTIRNRLGEWSHIKKLALT